MRRRRTNIKKPDVGAHTHDKDIEEARMKTWLRVKSLVNDGEFSKAARDINGAGVAQPTKPVVAELRRKYHKRREEVELPKKEEILKLLL